MLVAVTGATGHIGNTLCRALVERGHRVKALVREDVSSLQDLDVTFIHGDLFSESALNELLQNADSVCHSAAVISIGATPQKWVHHVNVEGTKQVLDAAERNGIKDVFYLSSIHAHQAVGLDGKMDESTPLKQIGGAYDISKAMAEQEVIAAREKGLNTTIFNPTAVIGPFDFKPGLTGKLLMDIAQRKIPMLAPLGYDWVDVRDVADSIAMAIEQSVRNEKFILSGEWRSIAQAAGIAAEYSNVAPPRFTAPFWLAKLGVPFIQLHSKLMNQAPLYTYESLRTIETSGKGICADHAREKLNHRSRPLEESIHDALKWFRQQGYLN